MKILSVEEAEGLEPLGKGRFTWLYSDLSLLKVGEGLVISYTDWKTNTTPYATIRKVAKNLNRTFNYGRHPDGSGWLVKRAG